MDSIISTLQNYQGDITVGQWVSCTLYDMGLGVVYAISDDVNKGKITHVVGQVTTEREGGNVFVAFLSGRKCSFSEMLLRKGVQFALIDKPLATLDTIQSLITQAKELEAKLAADRELSAKLHREEVSAFRCDESLSHLTQFTERYPAASKVAKNLRLELKTFKGVKFNVKSSGRRSTIEWTDGVSEAQVRDLLARYVCEVFDHEKQSRIHTFTSWHEVFGSVDSLTCQRTYSDEVVKQALNVVCDEHETQTYTVDQYRSGALYHQNFIDCDAYSVHQLVRFYLIKHAVI
ncbi:hypothetical protein KW429_11805 [Vibrio fluvialis]|nr:hypothetical protein [Vibrio fluvialis]